MNDALWWTDKDGTMHERCKLIFSTGDSVEFDPGSLDGCWQRNSMAFFCAQCGTIWDRVLVRNSKLEVMAFDLFHVACISHPDNYNIPGSILADRLDALLPLLPENMLRREFIAHLQYAEREIALDNTNTAAGMVPDGYQGTLGGSDWNGQDLRNRGTG